MKYDDILMRIGEFGSYQKRVYYLLCLPAMLCGAQVFSAIFMYNIPFYRCRIPDYPDDSYDLQDSKHVQAVNLSIPPGDGHDAEPYAKCDIYSHFNATSFLANQTEWPAMAWNASATQSCDGWVYDQSEVVESVITEFDLVCDLTILRSHSFMLMFAGALFGSIFMGIFADVFGRRTAILLSLVMHFITSLGMYFAPAFEYIMGIRAINGISVHSLFATSATTGIEIVGPSKRAFTGIVVELFWSTGVLLLLPIAYFVRDWRNLQLILCLLSVPIFAINWWFIPESPRWLLDKGKYEKADRIVKKICQSNNTRLPPGAVGADTTDDGPRLKIWTIFQHKTLVFRYSVVFYNWFAVNLIYYGLSINTGNLAGSLFVNYLISGVAEAVAYMACLPLLHFCGRRTVFCAALFLGSFSCIASIFSIIFHAPDWLTITFNMIGKFAGSMCYAVVYVLSAELFPTVLRYSGIGFCSIFENVGGMVSSYVADLSLLVSGPAGPAFHMIVFGGVSLLAALLSLLLPETRDRILPETLQDAIKFGRDRSNSDAVKPYQKELESLKERMRQTDNPDYM